MAVVLAVVISLFDILRGKRSVPLTKQSGTAHFKNSCGTAVGCGRLIEKSLLYYTPILLSGKNFLCWSFSITSDSSLWEDLPLLLPIMTVSNVGIREHELFGGCSSSSTRLLLVQICWPEICLSLNGQEFFESRFMFSQQFTSLKHWVNF